jgi:hypothetical protein
MPTSLQLQTSTGLEDGCILLSALIHLEDMYQHSKKSTDSIFRIEITVSSETSVPAYQTTRRNVPLRRKFFTSLQSLGYMAPSRLAAGCLLHVTVETADSSEICVSRKLHDVRPPKTLLGIITAVNNFKSDLVG